MEKDILQANMLKYAKSIVLLSDDITPDNALQMVDVLKNSIIQLEKALYKEKGKYYTKDHKIGLN